MCPKEREAGFSLVTVLVALALVGLLSVFFGQVMTNMMKGQRRIDLKSDAQNLEMSLKYLLTAKDRCKSLFRLNTSSYKLGFLKTALPSDPAVPKTAQVCLPQIDFNGTKITSIDAMSAGYSPVADSGLASAPFCAVDTSQYATTMGDSTLASKAKHGNLFIEKIEFTISKPPIAANQYMADFVVTSVPMDKQPGVLGFVNSFPVFLQTTDDSGDPTRVLITDCAFQPAEKTPAESCKDIGGRWLQATQPGRFMPKERCVLGSDLVLAMNESPDDIPQDGGISAQSERLETCYYQATGATTISEFSCPGVAGNSTGQRCAWNSSAREWWVIQYTSGVPSTTPWARCTRGVKVTLKGPDAATITWNTPLTGPPASGAPFTSTQSHWFLDQSDHLEAVAKCYKLPDSSAASDCKNVYDIQGARSAEPGSCIFVKGIKLSGTTQAQLNTFNPNGIAPQVNDYTGWIYVTATRDYTTWVAYHTSGDPPDWKQKLMKEAVGNACYRVEINTTAYQPKKLTANLSPEPRTAPSGSSQNLLTNPTRIKQCIYAASPAELTVPSLWVQSAGTGGKIKQVFECNNGAISALPNLQYDITQAGLARKDWLGYGSGSPQMATGTCWYVKDLKIAPSFYTGSLGSGNEPIPTDDSLGGFWSYIRYTGWVYFTASMPNPTLNLVASPTPSSVPATAPFDIEIGTSSAGAIIRNPQLPPTSGTDTAITAIPCTFGARFETD